MMYFTSTMEAEMLVFKILSLVFSKKRAYEISSAMMPVTSWVSHLFYHTIGQWFGINKLNSYIKKRRDARVLMRLASELGFDVQARELESRLGFNLISGAVRAHALGEILDIRLSALHMRRLIEVLQPEHVMIEHPKWNGFGWWGDVVMSLGERVRISYSRFEDTVQNQPGSFAFSRSEFSVLGGLPYQEVEDVEASSDFERFVRQNGGLQYWQRIEE